VAIAARPRDTLFEALYFVWLGKTYDPADPGLTPGARGKLNKAAADLRKAGAHPDDVLAVAEAWVALWPGRSPPTWTPNACAEHWPALVAQMRRGYVARGSPPGSGEALRQALQANVTGRDGG
jgi:hypothetical protein